MSLVGIVDFTLGGTQKMIDDRLTDGKTVLEIRVVGEITSFPNVFEAVVLMITLLCHLL